MSNLYKTNQWTSLDEIDRAQLLLVIEGLKRGTIIGGNWTSLTTILTELGLEYELNTTKFRLDPVFVVARPEDLQEQNRRYLTLPENRYEFHEISGWFLGYPECCTAEYVKERTPEQIRADINGQRHLTYKFGQELDAQIKSEGSYPEIFDYRPPSFTPCGLECPEAIRVLSSWKEAIDTLDPKAAKELVFFNRQEFPERVAHEDYFLQEVQQRILEYDLELLRRSVW